MQPIIKVIGVGGSGSNTISRMTKSKTNGVEMIAINTDAQALHFCQSNKKILIGKEITQGLGTGMDASLGKKAAQESREIITESLSGADMVFITCGLGGGTGSGASVVISEIAKSLGILTIAVVTLPFSFEGSQRKKIADNALQDLKERVDSLIVIANDKLLKLIDEKTTVSETFLKCDEVLMQAVSGVADLILSPGIINIDFASVKSIMQNSGRSIFGQGIASGENRAVIAAQKAITSPLLDSLMGKAGGVLFCVFGNDSTLNEIQEVAKIVTESASQKAKIIFGAVKDNTLKQGEIKVTVIATNFQ